MSDIDEFADDLADPNSRSSRTFRKAIYRPHRNEFNRHLDAICEDIRHNLGDARDFGRWLLSPHTHFGAILSALSAEERAYVGMRAHSLYSEANSSDCTLHQFAAFALLVRGRPFHKYNHICRVQDPHSAEAVQLHYANSHDNSVIRAGIAGEDVPSVAKMFYTAIEEAQRAKLEIDTAEYILGLLHSRTRTAEDAVRIVSVAEATKKFIAVFQLRAEDLLAEANSYLRNRSLSERSANELAESAVGLERTLSDTLDAKPTITAMQAKIIRPDVLLDRFSLVREAELYVPKRREIVVAKTIDSALKSVAQDPSFLQQLSPRAFEEFIRDLFIRLGFEVELTQLTRDGGADLICMRDLHGIPLRMAVEVKRYKDTRPITVSLIRSFIGSNLQHRANKLVYITTSYYTQPARSFAAEYASHQLSLMQYDHLREWCLEAQRQVIREI